MKLKTIISFMAAGACVIAAQQAKANTIASETETLQGANHPADTISLSTVVTQVAPGEDYVYTYTLNTGSIGINSFTVTDVGSGPFDVFGLNSEYSDSILTSTTASIIANGWATWGAAGGATADGTLVFSFDSPFAPSLGTATIQDSQQYYTPPSGSANTFVPIPDGGLTVTLLGGAMTAMALIRRKLV